MAFEAGFKSGSRAFRLLARAVESSEDEDDRGANESLACRKQRLKSRKDKLDDEESSEEDPNESLARRRRMIMMPVAITTGSETIKINVNRRGLIRSDRLLRELSLSPWDWLFFIPRELTTHTGGQLVRADDTFTKLDIQANDRMLLDRVAPDNICARLAYTQIPEANRQEKREKIHERLLSISKLSPDTNKITETQVAQLLPLYDKHFFDGRLNSVLQQSAKKILVHALGAALSRSGYKSKNLSIATCSVGYDAKIAVINIDTLMIEEFFTAASTYTLGGMICQDAVACMQAVFEHELTHAIIGLFCGSLANEGSLGGWGGINDGVAHGRTFMSIINKTFGHVDFVGGKDAAHTDARNLKFVLQELQTNKKLKHIPANGQFAGEPILGYIRCLTNGIKFYVDKSNSYYKVKFQHVPYKKLKVEKNGDGKITSIDVGKLKRADA